MAAERFSFRVDSEPPSSPPEVSERRDEPLAKHQARLT